MWCRSFFGTCRGCSRAEFEALEESVEAAEENFRLQKEEYARNLVNNLDVLEAVEELQTARRNANRADHQMRQRFWELQIASGRGCSFEPGKGSAA